MTTASAKRLTYDQWQSLPETKGRCEVVDGVVCMPPILADERQWLGFRITGEVISPGNTRRYVADKLADYHSIGVLECWLVDFPSRSIEVWRLAADSMMLVATLGIEDTLRSDVLPGFAMPVADVFGPLLL